MPIITNNLEEIVKFITDNADRIDINLKLSDVLEDDIMGHVDEALRNELSRQPYSQARPRITPINVGKRIISKLSTLYSDNPNRDMPNGKDQELLNYYSQEMNLDVQMLDANIFYNTHKYVALEPYIDEGVKDPRIRVVPADRFLVWNASQNPDPSKPDVFIKFLGSTGKIGRFALYSKEEIVVIDVNQGGTVAKNVRNSSNNNLTIISSEENPYGVIPFVYISKSKYRIMPAPDEPLFRMSVLMATLLTDLNFISKFQAFSMMYTVDIDTGNIETGPNNVLNFKSEQSVGSKPEVGTLTPNAKINDLMGSIQNQMSMFLETRNLKASTTSRGGGDSSASGLALMIRNIDTTEDRKAQAIVFGQAETELMSLISNHLHPVWVENQQVNDLRLFTAGVKLNIKYAEQRPIVSQTELVENALLKRDNGLTTQEMALQEVHPTLSKEEIQTLSKDIENERVDTVRIQSDFSEGFETGTESPEPTEAGE